MGVETAVAVGSMVVGSLVSYAMTPKSPSYDATDYQMLMETQKQASAESDEAKARIEAARKREELRQQSLQYQDVLTSDSGDDSDLAVTDSVLGRGR